MTPSHPRAVAANCTLPRAGSQPQHAGLCRVAARLARRPGTWLLLALCGLLFFWKLGSVPIFDLDEALYVTAAREMVLTGNLITPKLNSRPLNAPTRTLAPFFEKPILVYWLAAGSMKALGVSEVAARLPAAVLSLAAVATVILAGASWFGDRAGLLAGLIYATAPMTVADARQMTTDALLVLWFLWAMLAFRLVYERAFGAVDAADPPGPATAAAELAGGADGRGPGTARSTWGPAMAFWACCALAVLTKGAIGLLLPLLVAVVYLLLGRTRLRCRQAAGLDMLFRLRLYPLRRVAAGLRALHPLIGFALFLAISAPWHILVWRAGGIDANGHTFFGEYVMEQHIGRFRGLDTVHNAPIVTYVGYFLLGFFPWSCLTIAGFRAIRDADPLASGRRRFLLVWFWSIFAFFSLGAAKLPTYIVPGYPAAALLLGCWLEQALMRPEAATSRSLVRAAVAAALTAALLVIAAVVGPRLAPKASPVPVSVGEAVLETTAALLLLSLAALVLLRLGRLRWGAAALGATLPIALLVGIPAGYAAVRAHLQGPYQQIAVDARPDARAGIPVVFYNIIPRRPSMNFYARYSPIELKDPPLLPFLMPYLQTSPAGVDVVTPEHTLDTELTAELARTPDVRWTVRSVRGLAPGGWILLRLRSRQPNT